MQTVLAAAAQCSMQMTDQLCLHQFAGKRHTVDPGCACTKPADVHAHSLCLWLGGQALFRTRSTTSATGQCVYHGCGIVSEQLTTRGSQHCTLNCSRSQEYVGSAVDLRRILSPVVVMPSLHMYKQTCPLTHLVTPVGACRLILLLSPVSS